MSNIGALEVGLFTCSCILTLPGLLLLVGWYGFPASPLYGWTFVILGSMCGAIFIALVNEEAQESH